MTYTILKASSIEDLEALVRYNLAQGYSLVGGISVVPNRAFAIGALKDLRADTVLNLEEFSYDLLYCQAVMKEELYQKEYCYWCNNFIENENRTIEHIEELTSGGKHSAENLTMACLSCNSARKGRKNGKSNSNL